jgi:hypothetical protein
MDLSVVKADENLKNDSRLGVLGEQFDITQCKGGF